ncbi:MAG: CPBP family intramembrane glutamic endopeptidase [Candidatus Sulfotelmatobacter sp.]
MILYEHALALFLFVGVPVWDALETRALKSSTNPRRKIRSYQRILLILWTSSIVAWIALRSSVFFVWPAVRVATQQKIGASFAWGFGAAFAVGSLLQVVLVRRSATAREKILRAFRRFAFILPVTPEERAWFALVSVTAGICEEVLYRGFLIRYLSDGPWHAGLWIALAVASVSFGLGHGYQGLPGIIGTTLVGGVMAVIFLASGSLWLPMALHAIIDLRLLLLLRPGDLAS